MTNGDKIRQMSDEKLIANFRSGICCIIQDADSKWCSTHAFLSCDKCQREWLKKEVST